MSTERISWNVGKNYVTIKADGQTYTIKDSSKDGKISQSEIDAALKGKDGRAMSSRLRSLFIQLGKNERSLDDIQSKFKAISTDSNSLEAIDKQIAKETRLKKEKMAELRNKRTQLSNAIKTYNHVKAQFVQQQKREAMMQRQMQTYMMSPMNMMSGAYNFPNIVQGFNMPAMMGMPGMQGSMMMPGMMPTMASVGITEDELNEIGEAINEEVDKFKDELSEAGIDEDDLKTGDFEKIKIDVKEENGFEFVQEGKDRKSSGSTSSSSIDDLEGLSKEEKEEYKKLMEELKKEALDKEDSLHQERMAALGDDTDEKAKELHRHLTRKAAIIRGDFGSDEDGIDTDEDDGITAQHKKDFNQSKKTRIAEHRKTLKELEKEYKTKGTTEERKREIENLAKELRQKIQDIDAEEFDASTSKEKKTQRDDKQFEATQIAAKLSTQIKARWFDENIADAQIAKINKDNILEVLHAYGSIAEKQGQDLFEGFVKEWMEKEDKKAYLRPIKDALIARIKEEGHYSQYRDDIANLENAWDSEYDGVHPLCTDESKVANAFHSLYEKYNNEKFIPTIATVTRDPKTGVKTIIYNK